MRGSDIITALKRYRSLKSESESERTTLKSAATQAETEKQLLERKPLKPGDRQQPPERKNDLRQHGIKFKVESEGQNTEAGASRNESSGERNLPKGGQTQRGKAKAERQSRNQ